jgi:predicted transcriptional regulator
MSILKAPPKQPKNATLQIRVDEELKTRLDKYAEFLDSTESYVVSEALKLVFNKDAEFKEWLERHGGNGAGATDGHAPVKAVKDQRQPTSTSTIPKVNGNQLFG